MRKLDTYTVDWFKIAEGFRLPIDQTIQCFYDGRMMGRIGEFMHKVETGGEREGENSSFDITESDGIRSEVRSITNKVSFAPSKQTGFGRKVTEEGFQEKLRNLDRFVLLDLRELEDGIIHSIEVTKEDIFNLPLGKNKAINSKKFYEIYDRAQQNL
jgi:hypothetical protein